MKNDCKMKHIMLWLLPTISFLLGGVGCIIYYNVYITFDPSPEVFLDYVWELAWYQVMYTTSLAVVAAAKLARLQLPAEITMVIMIDIPVWIYIVLTIHGAFTGATFLPPTLREWLMSLEYGQGFRLEAWISSLGAGCYLFEFIFRRGAIAAWNGLIGFLCLAAFFHCLTIDPVRHYMLVELIAVMTIHFYLAYHLWRRNVHLPICAKTDVNADTKKDKGDIQNVK